MFRLLILASLCWITVAGSTCPKGFKLFERNPTARNNHTKQWCLGVVSIDADLGVRDLARSMCVRYNSSLSIPENSVEAEYLWSRNHTGFGIAMDGEVTPKCKNFWSKKPSLFLFKETNGSCHIEKDMFGFEDSNSDPAFIKHLFNNIIPGRMESYSSDVNTDEIYMFASCAVLKKITNYYPVENPSTNKTEYVEWTTYGETAYCMGDHFDTSNWAKKDNITSVVCGRHPL